MHPVQLELLAKAHIEELGAEPPGSWGWEAEAPLLQGATGWFLVNLGCGCGETPAVPVATR